MGRLYDEADLFLNGSDIDNMPLSILDAFAAGTPVVTTDAGGIPYLVNDGRTGIVVRRGDDAALAEGALRLLRDGALAARIASTARAECVSRYTWRAVRAEWMALYTGSRQAALPPVGVPTVRIE
jgi:glycosyltransferase involved in cell wall biosynthesis